MSEQDLLEVLTTTPTDGDCQYCLEQLSPYVDAQLAGAPYRQQFPQVAAHLDLCPDCAAAYARHYELERMAQAHDIPQPTAVPAPDLSFLETGASKGVVEWLREGLQRTGKTTSLQLNEALVALLRPSPQLATVRSRDDRYGDVLLQLDQETVPAIDLPLTLTAYRDTQQPDICLLELQIAPDDDTVSDLDAAQVVLTYGDTTHRATADIWGVVAFADIPIAQLPNLEITVSRRNY